LKRNILHNRLSKNGRKFLFGAQEHARKRKNSSCNTKKNFFLNSSKSKAIVPFLAVAIPSIAIAIGPQLALPSSTYCLNPRIPGGIGMSTTSPYTLGSIPMKGLASFSVLPSQFEIELAFRLIYASLVGAAVGLERRNSNHPAGVRTMSLVSLGACAFTLCSMYGFVGIPYTFGNGYKVDPSRMASNVASGVGFIGAGVITSDARNNVNGLTTAAAIWMAAAVGVTSGVGLYFISGVATITTIVVLSLGKSRRKVAKLTRRMQKQRSSSLFRKQKSSSLKSPSVNSSDQLHIINPSKVSLQNSKINHFSECSEDMVQRVEVAMNNYSTPILATDQLVDKYLRDTEDEPLLP